MTISTCSEIFMAPRSSGLENEGADMVFRRLRLFSPFVSQMSPRSH